MADAARLLKQSRRALVELVISLQCRLRKVNLALHTTRVIMEDNKKELSKALSRKNSQIKSLKRRIRNRRRRGNI